MSNPWSEACPEETLLSLLDSGGYHSDIPDDCIEDNSSLLVIRALDEISALSSKMNCVEYELLERNLYKQDKEIISVESLENLKKITEELARCLNQILEHRDELLERLRTPADASQFVIEARFQKYAVSTFQHLGSIVSNLAHHLRHMDKYNSLSLLEGEISVSIRDIQQHTVILNSVYTLMQGLHTTLRASTKNDLSDANSTSAVLNF